MPGMMDTVLNLGLNETTLQGLIAFTGNERFGWDAYRRFISMFGRIVPPAGQGKTARRSSTTASTSHSRPPRPSTARTPRTPISTVAT